MTGRLQEAARRALARAPRPQDGERASVERAVFDVTVAGRTELVTVTVRDGELVCTTTDGVTEGPHVRAALQLLAGEALADESVVPLTAGGPSTGHGLPAGAVRTLSGMPAPVTADHLALAEALDDVMTAVVRLGVREAQGSPSVDETLGRLIATAPDPLPLGVARWVGRLRSALATGDVGTAALVLEGAARLSSDLRSARSSPEGVGRRVAWLGPSATDGDDMEPLYDRTLVEVGREWLPGVEQSLIERRYLLDLHSGALYREERLAGALGASVGPCPRLLTVGFAEVDRGPPPRRIRLLQYAVAIDVGGQEWTQVRDWASPDFRPPVEDYREALSASPGLAEPFALVAPAKCEVDEGRAVLLDLHAQPLPLARLEDPAGAARVDALAAQGRIDWVAGRLVHAGDALMMTPASVAVRHDGSTVVRRIT